jgi:asparagine synthase (glutamine-hydrolysing)
MCGIAGILGLAPELSRPAAERMRDALRHRGPDDHGIQLVDGPVGRAPAVLVHTRLAIVDLSRDGHQPMSDRGRSPDDLANVITFNGEIYNYRELQPELARAGFPCRTRSDVEVVLNAYRAWGPRAVERFEGMFAFCLLDRARGLAWFCRDRVGIKPVYLLRPARGGLVFASEVRALFAAGPEVVTPRLNRSAIESFLAQGAVIGEDSILEGARLLPPGESLLCDFEGNLTRTTRYWSVAFGSPLGEQTQPADGSSPQEDGKSVGLTTPSRDEVVSELSAALRRSLGRLLLADVPVGLFLSSGVDSAAVAAVAAEVTSQPLRTLAIGFDVPALDETSEAALTARDLGTVHTRIALTGESVLASFEDVLAAVDQPTVDGFNTFFISRAARQAGLTVALSGLGGDELFGGYASFKDVPRALDLRKAADAIGPQPRELLSLAAQRAAALPFLGSRGRALAKLGQALTGPSDLVSMYFLRRELFTPERRRGLQPLPDRSDARFGLERDVLVALRASHADRSREDRIAALEFSTYMRHMLLRDADVFGMAHALEIRVPLLEHYVVAQAARAAGVWRRSDPRPKPLLVDAVGERLPPRSWRAKKRGFTFPWRAWLSGPLRGRVEEGLRSAALRDGGFAAAGVEAIRKGFFEGDRRVSELEVLGLLVFESMVRAHRLSA